MCIRDSIYSAYKGHASAVALLLGNDRVDPNIAGRKGFTALMWAAGKGHDSVVKVLLADGRVDPVREAERF